MPVEGPARLWRQCGEDWELDDLIAAGDFLVHPERQLATLADLAREVLAAGDVHGGRLEQALALIRPGAESAPETRMRLAMVRAGLPEPSLQHQLFGASGEFIARLDAAYPRYHVAVEYDGRQHALAEQFSRDADRWDAIRAAGWTLVRVLSHHLWPTPQPAVDRVSTALFEAGWRPGRL